MEDLFQTVLAPGFLRAIGTTVMVSGVAGSLAIVLGLAAAFCRLSGLPPLGFLATGYVELFRNTPLLLQLYFYYKGLQSIGLLLDPIVCGILGLSLYTGAYLAEVFRSGLLSLPRSQQEAGLALGLRRFEVYWLVLIPQTFRIILPALCNQLINLTKNSSLLAFITVQEIFYQIYAGTVDQFQPIKFFLIGALLYVTLTLAIAAVAELVDRLLARRTLRFPALTRSEAQG